MAKGNKRLARSTSSTGSWLADKEDCNRLKTAATDTNGKQSDLFFKWRISLANLFGAARTRDEKKSFLEDIVGSVPETHIQ